MLPETKGLTLEELDSVFSVGNTEFAKYYAEKLPWYMQTKVLRKDVPPMEPLYRFDGETPGMFEEKEKVGGVEERRVV